MRKFYLLLYFLLLTSFVSNTAFAKAKTTETTKITNSKKLEFIQNKNQLPSQVNFLCQLGMLDRVYLEDASFTYVFHDNSKLEHQDHEGHDHKNGCSDHSNITGINAHAYRVNFLGADDPILIGEDEKSYYHNYFIGSDSDRWASKVPVFEEVKYSGLYSGIDLQTYSVDGLFKYDFIIAPGADVNDIKLEYEAVDGLFLKDNTLHIPVVGKTVFESEPYAYQVIDGNQIQVPCLYKLEGQILSYEFPAGYNRNIPLVIDPIVVASTLTGSPSFGGFGHTAAYDQEGNMYLGGISFGSDYPVTFGAFQTTYGGGGRDISVSKFNPTGTNLIYATYLGSNRAEWAHSIIVDNNKQLCVFGTTEGANYPITPNAYQSQFNGRTDIVVTKLGIDGSSLIGSTYMGGSESDGQNLSSLNSNYGDDYRGEINVDQAGNIYIASCSSSPNFPVTSNAYQTEFNSTTTSGTFLNRPQDGVIFKMSNDLSTLFWSTYLGGNDADMVSSLRIGADEEIYITGTAGHSNFPTTAGTIQPNWPGGEESSFVSVLSANGANLLRSTFWGGGGDEHGYFLDLDEDENVHILGQSTGIMPITPDTYAANPLSRQFISGFTNDLTSVVYSTVIGNGGVTNTWFGEGGFVPVAFMVDKCNGIYFSGYYAQSGLPTTPDAISQGGPVSFYLGVLGPNAKELVYGTYFGNADHVDGGTSRFDKGGIVYQAVCSCLADNRVLNTNLDAFAGTQTANCNAGIFKIDFEIESVTSAFSINQSATGCVPYEVNFAYTGEDGTNFFWDFDDKGASSTLQNPSHIFEEAGKYRVMMIAENPNSCNLSDTSYVSINVLGGPGELDTLKLCGNSEPVFLEASVFDANYSWQDGSNTSTFEVDAPGEYWVDIFIPGCSTRDSFVVTIQDNDFFSLGPDVISCDTFDLEVVDIDALNYQWSTGSTESSISISETGEYIITVSAVDRCVYIDSVQVVIDESPDIDFNVGNNICPGDTVLLDPGLTGGVYEWQDGSTDSIYQVTETGLYTLHANFESCDVMTEIQIEYIDFTVNLGEDQTICSEEEFNLMPVVESPGATIQGYNWSSGSSDFELMVNSSGTYWVEVTDAFGCVISDTLEINFSGIADPELEDLKLCVDDSLRVDLESLGETYLWQDGSTEATIDLVEAGEYWVNIERDGCERRDTFNVEYYLVPYLGFTTTNIDCHGDCSGAIALNPATTITEFSWSNGESTPDISSLCASDYILSYKDVNDCAFKDTFVVAEPEPLDFSYESNSFDCDGLTIGAINIDTVFGGVSPYQYSIEGSELQEENNFSELSSGSYLVEIVDGKGCSISTEVNVETAEANLLAIGSDVTIELGSEIQLNANIPTDENYIYSWSPPEGLTCVDCPDPLASPVVPITYSLIATNLETGCILVDEIFVDVFKAPTVYAPNIFTPNAEVDNQWFTLYSEDAQFTVDYLLIYDRWGNQVFENKNFELNIPEEGWDGKFKGEDLGSGVYVYIAEVVYPSGEIIQLKGDLTLMR